MSCRYIPDWAWLSCISYFNGACAYCGATGKKLTADHLIPKSAGGKDELANIVPACEECNRIKADQEWRDFMLGLPTFSQDRMNTIFNWRRICRQSMVD